MTNTPDPDPRTTGRDGAAACVTHAHKCIGSPMQAAAFRGTSCRVSPSPVLLDYQRQSWAFSSTS